MKRLRVLLACLIVALLCWYPGRYVCCSEQLSTGPVRSAQDSGRHTLPEQGTDEKAEEWEEHVQSSYDTEEHAQLLHDAGLEPVRAAPEQTGTQDVPQEVKQTVNTVEKVVEEVRSETEPSAPEPEPQHPQQPDQRPAAQHASTPPQTHLDPDAPPSPTQDHTPPASAASPTRPADTPAEPHPEAQTESVPDSATAGTPTSQTSAESVSSSALDSPSAGAAVENSSASECEVGTQSPSSEPLPLGTTLTSVVVEHVENLSITLGRGKGTNADLPSSLGPGEQVLPESQTVGDSSQPLESEQQGANSVGVRETDPSVPSKEDIPTFDEWKKKVMEVEKEKSQSLHSSSGGGAHAAKKVQKSFKNNYASVECGAKILSANSEAKSTSAILMENMDLYMLNPCSNKIWFVIELCEPIQVKQLDIANFELFSSTPKDFLVSISDRYPTNKWVKLGTFHARDERTVQSFPLDEQMYAKYVKVELLSHFGSEHFCPLSLIRVFGTSMVEEYDEIADSQDPSERLEYLDEDYDLLFADYPPGFLPSEDKTSKNLLGSATNAILSMVNNIAANVLGAKPDLQDGSQTEGNISSRTENVTEASTETLLTPTPTPTTQPTLDTPEQEPPVQAEGEDVSAPDTPTEKIVILLEGVEEEEDLAQPTVTLLEDEEDEEELRSPEEVRQKESVFYCGHLSTSSCLATLEEHLLRRCSAALALRRQHMDRPKTPHARAHADTHAPPRQSPPGASSAQDVPNLSEKLPESEPPSPVQGESIAPTSTAPSPSPRDGRSETSAERPPETIVLEPSRTSILPPHSFSDTSLAKPTPTEEIPEPLPSGEPQEQRPQYLERIPETRVSPSNSLSSTSAPPSSLSFTTEPLSPQSEPPKTDLPLPTTELPVQPLPTHTRPADIPPPTELPAPPSEASDPGRAGGAEDSQQRVGGVAPSEVGDASLMQGEESVEDMLLSVPSSHAALHRTATDFYAELHNSSELSHGNGNGNQVHGSNQKESVFMRLNNRIKALEMNMSLSSRYLEELSQRYRKQMEEMQKAFNKTIIKLQNTSRIAEEQDQKQTESIQVLQSQLENVTKLMLNLSSTVSQLQREVSDRQSYLVVSLFLCLTLGLLLCVQCCRNSPSRNSSPVSNHYPSPKRCFSSYDDMSLKRRVSCPLVRSKSFQLPTTTEGPDDLFIVEPLRFSPEKKKKRCKMKGGEKVETLRPSVSAATIANGAPRCNGVHVPRFLPSGEGDTSTCSSRDGVSEGSSEGSSTLSDESNCSPNSSANGLCHDQLPDYPPPKTKTEKRSFRRRRSRLTEQQHGCCGGEVLHAPVPVSTGIMPTLEELMKRKQDLGVGTFGVTAVTGRV
ncbi:SUN domain-containing ossification factor isoform X2 [Chanos chanos]|uniref:SUN domain-containing ossification factor isoform X2 n=1 Tax=Chanos chanos TaxID=29144 RepID=A0A6J2V7L3_CHACN|nr:SUN domain-containing ossification factor isoform X2 [Chanos chanos]